MDVPSELLPCPFCGSDVPEVYGAQVICEKCGAGTMVHDKRAEAITAWNTRAPGAERLALRELARSIFPSLKEQERT